MARAFQVLRLLANSNAPLGVSEIARAIHASKGSVHGILQALAAEGAVEESGRARFGVGPLLRELGRERGSERTPVALSRSYLEGIARETGQTAVFGVPEGDRLRIAAVVEGEGPFRVGAAPGRRIPLLAGATGKVWLAWATTPWPDPLPHYTGRTVTDRAALEREVSEVRRAGVAYDRGEYLQGVAAAAAPVRGRGDRLVGVLYAVGFLDRLGDEVLRDLGEHVGTAARSLSVELS
ncbi:MAG: IclR family transcriptional regulator [Deltaproteobacteria bacterium]|nr:IclR family transcriptional regulator [Deltaproteobacteria bacterium]